MAVPPTSSTTSLFNLADIFLCLILHVNNVEGKQNEELNMNLLVEIKSATDESKTENVFPLPLSNFFQVKGLSRGKHLVQLKSNRPLGSHKVVSEIIEVDFETNAQIHVGPLRYSIVADHQSQFEVYFGSLSHCIGFQEVTPAAILPLVTGIAAIALFISIPRFTKPRLGCRLPGSLHLSRENLEKLSLERRLSEAFTNYTGVVRK
nr:unnamed protein product [Brassica oleracea]